MPNDIVVQSDKNGGKVHLSADRVYDLNKNKTQDVINAEFEPLMQLDSEVAIVIDGRSCTLGALSGQYVILQNSTIAGKSDGLYTVATGKTIPIGATNVTADMLANPIPRGGLNSLSESVKTALNSKADEETLAYRRTGATNTGAQIENGTYFYLDGTLKRAIATIATNAYFTAQNCETVPGGGLNALYNYFNTIEVYTPTITDIANCTISACRARIIGKICELYLGITTTVAMTANTEYTIGTLPSEFRPLAIGTLSSSGSTGIIYSSGSIRVRPTLSLTSGTPLYLSSVYFIN